MDDVLQGCILCIMIVNEALYSLGSYTLMSYLGKGEKGSGNPEKMWGSTTYRKLRSIPSFG